MRTLIFFLILSFAHLTIAQTQADTLALIEMVELGNNKEFKKALAKANEFLNRTDMLDVYSVKSQLLVYLERMDEAEENYEKALKIYPTSYHLYFDYGVLLNNVKKNDKSIENLTLAFKYAETDEEKSAALTSRAAVYSSFRESLKAYEDLIKALEFYPDNVATLVNLGAVCDDINKFDEAIKHLVRAVELAPDFIGGYLNLGFRYQEKGDYKTSLLYFDKVLSMDDKEPLGYSNRAYTYLMMGDTKKAMKDIKKSIELFPTNSYAYMVEALILIENGKKKEACESLSTAITHGFTERYGPKVQELQKEHCK